MSTPARSTALNAPAHPLPELVLIGGGGHALVVAEALALAHTASIVGFLDDNPAAPLGAILIDRPQPFATPHHLGALHDAHHLTGRSYIVALGDAALRRTFITHLAAHHHAAGLAPAPALSVIHPHASVSPSALIGPGVFVGPKAVVHSRARIGAHAIVNSGAIVEHDCVVGENTHIAPGAVLGGGALIAHDTLVGLGSRVLPRVRIGHNCVVGAGAVVVDDVADAHTVVGIPAR
jgi:sugar O-acyltransferase (sialic acid O-acetyltransferase NeuD family)